MEYGFPTYHPEKLKKQEKIAIMKCLPLLWLCPSENLHCPKEFHAGPNEITTKSYLHECAISVWMLSSDTDLANVNMFIWLRLMSQLFLYKLSLM